MNDNDSTRICTAEFEVSNDLLHKLLNLPGTTTILRVDYRNPFVFTVTVSDPRRLPAGHRTVVPVLRTVEFDYDVEERV